MAKLQSIGFGKCPGGGLQGGAAPVRRFQGGEGAGHHRAGLRGKDFRRAGIKIARTIRVQKFRPLIKFHQGLGPLFERGHRRQEPRARRLSERMRGGVSRSAKAVTSATITSSAASRI